MRFFFASIIALITLASAADLTSPLEGFSVSTVSWDIEVFPGKVQTLTGTIQEAYAQAQALNPDFKIPAPRKRELPGISSLKNRNVFTKRNHIQCDIGFTADKGRIIDGVNYLRGVNTADPVESPHGCGRVSCSYKSAIWWCNNTDRRRVLHNGWDALANSAMAIVNKCAVGNVVCGKNFEDSKWITIVKLGDC